MIRSAFVALAIAIASVVLMPPANAGVNDIKKLAKKFTGAGYECTVKRSVMNFREANCYLGEKYVHMVAFSSPTAYGQWIPLWCDIASGEPFISDRKTWVVDSTEVPLKELRRIVGGKVTDVC